MSHFISYSRADKKLIAPLVNWLRTAVPEDRHIFRDEDSIRYGDYWEQAISNAIKTCINFYVFWCSHSRASPHVASEIRQARYYRKRIIPIMVDLTPLTWRLRRYHAVDFRELKLHPTEPLSPSQRRLLSGYPDFLKGLAADQLRDQSPGSVEEILENALQTVIEHAAKFLKEYAATELGSVEIIKERLRASSSEMLFKDIATGQVAEHDEERCPTCGRWYS